MYETELPEWMAVAEAMVRKHYDEKPESVELDDIDPTDKTRTIIVKGHIYIDTTTEASEMDYFNGTGVRGGEYITGVTFFGTMRIEDEDCQLVYEQDVKFEIE